MILSYAICVCDEHKELKDLLEFLTLVKEPEDEIVILVDSSRETKEVKDVLNKFKECVVNRRDFCGDFAKHRNYHNSLCKGEYIFVIDADEMPRENMIKNVKYIISQSNAELIYVPRTNICPGYTEYWLKKHSFNINNIGYINWPDYQSRIYKNDSNIKWSNSVHEKIIGAKKITKLEALPDLSLWHIKNIERQNKQNELYEKLI